MGGSGRFKVGEYDGDGGLSKKVVFWPEFRDKVVTVFRALISGELSVDWR